MIPIQSVTLVARGGTPAQLANQKGAPYPTTGFGALVFNEGPLLRNPTIEDPVILFDVITVRPGDFFNPAIQFSLEDDKTPGFFSTGPGNISLVGTSGAELSRTLLAQFDFPGDLTIPRWGFSQSPPANDSSQKLATTVWVNEFVGSLPAGQISILPTIAALKAMTLRPLVAITEGYNAAGDGGGGPPWVWMPGSVAVADDFMVVSPAGLPLGRYIRSLQAGANVSPKWAGCGLGAADDSAQFQKVLNFGAAVDASGGTYPIKNLTVVPGNVCPGIFSDGTGTLTNPAGTTVADKGITVTKQTAFYFRKMRLIAPISTSGTVPPTFDRMIWFVVNPPATADGWEVSDCYIEGGQYGVITGGIVSNMRIERNTITGTWREGITGPDAPDGLFITDNDIHDGGYSTTGGSGAIRIGAGGQTVSSHSVSICRNHISRYFVALGQSAIDCFSASSYNIDVSGNVIEGQSGGIELKTTPAAIAGETYQGLTVRNNTIRSLPVAATMISIFHASAGSYAGKAARVLVEGNHLSCPSRAPAGNNVYGILLEGFEDSDIKGNFIIGATHGIHVTGLGPVGTTARGIYIDGNTVDAFNAALEVTNASTNRLFIHNNPMLKARVGQAVYLPTGLRDVSIRGNYIWGQTTPGLEMRDVTDAIITGNTIVGGTYAIRNQVSPLTNVVIENNRLRTTWDDIPAASGTVTTPGAGLTDGTRIFTVTSGTGTTQTVFSCVVAGGTITGPVVIIEPGAYTVFPAVPTVTVDTGIVGGATFALTSALAVQALRFDLGTGITVQSNFIDIPVINGSLLGAATYLTANNIRGTISADPTGTFAGSVGDTFFNGNPVTGVLLWTCTVAGTTATAVWQPTTAGASQVVDTLAALKALTSRPAVVIMRGYLTLNDGGGGPQFIWMAGSVLTADDVLVVTPTAGPAGRWVRQLTGGSAINAKWGGCGLGAADDSAQFRKVLDNFLGAPIDISGSTVKVKNVSVVPGNICAGIFSDGSGILTGPAGVTFADNGITVTKPTSFYFRDLTVIMAVSTNPVVDPTGQNRMIWFSVSDPTIADGWEVTGVKTTGGQGGIIMAGRCRNCKVLNNYVTGTFGDGISGFGNADNCFIENNTITDSCYSSGALQPAGAIRVGSSTQPFPGRNLSIRGNHIVRCSVPADQSAIDCFTDNAYSYNVSDNIIEDCGGGIEIKTVPITPTAGEPQTYGEFNVSNNIIRALNKNNTPGISVFHAGAGNPEGKCAKLMIEGNHITCKERATSGFGVYGVAVSGYNDVVIRNNFILDVTHGITVDGNGITSGKSYRITVDGNVVDAVTAAVAFANTANAFLTNNPLIKSQFSPAVSLNTGVISDLVMSGNYVLSTVGAAVDIRDVRNSVIRNNTIIGATNALVTQGTAPTNLVIEDNRLGNSWQTIPAVSGTVTAPGAGLTDGRRYFTVTNGTGTVPTIFSCVVTGGTITGPVVIVQPGMYSVFPTVPTVTVDTGIVGGATFTLVGAVASSMANFAFPVILQNNSIDVQPTQRSYIGAGVPLAMNNVRGTVTADPTGTYAASVGDVWLNGTPTTGIHRWVCTTPGNAGANVIRPDPPTPASIAPAVLGANVPLNNTANYFNGPNTGALGPGTWLLYANYVVGQPAGGPDFYATNIWDGSAIIGGEQVLSAPAGVNMAGSCFGVATVAFGTTKTYTLRAKDVSSTTGALLSGGTSIGAVRLA